MHSMSSRRIRLFMASLLFIQYRRVSTEAAHYSEPVSS